MTNDISMGRVAMYQAVMWGLLCSACIYTSHKFSNEREAETAEYERIVPAVLQHADTNNNGRIDFPHERDDLLMRMGFDPQGFYARPVVQYKGSPFNGDGTVTIPHPTLQLEHWQRALESYRSDE